MICEYINCMCFVEPPRCCDVNVECCIFCKDPCPSKISGIIRTLRELMLKYPHAQLYFKSRIKQLEKLKVAIQNG